MAELDKIRAPNRSRFHLRELQHLLDLPPWVGGENIKPKSGEGDVFSSGASPSRYIQYSSREQRGSAAQYLSQLIKHSSDHSRVVLDRRARRDKAFLLTAIQRTDREPVEEWDGMMEESLWL